MDTFATLSLPVRNALSERGFMMPTEPQRRAIPPPTDGNNGFTIASTGTGKTETAMSSVFSVIADAEDRLGIPAPHITPLRALNCDMRERLDWWGEQLDIDIDVRHGDTTQYQRQKQANDLPDVLVTAPETLQAMLTGKKPRKALSDVHHVVVDEVHELVSAKRGAQLIIGLERLRELAGAFQRIGLSATVGPPNEAGKFLTGDRPLEVIEVDVDNRVEFEAVRLEVTNEDEALAGKLAIDPEIASHVRTIRDIVRDYESVLVLVNTRQTVEVLGSRFKLLGDPIEIHHGSLSKDVRVDVEDRLKAGELDAFICTSPMELGIDVGRVDHVIQYNSSHEMSRLLQRVDRVGHRLGVVSCGTVVTDHPDNTLEAFAIIWRAVSGEVESARVRHRSLDTAANQIVGVIMDYGDVSARRVYEIITRVYPFRDLDEDDFRVVVRELSGNHLPWPDEDKDLLEKPGGTWQYLYANLPMIPGEETYDIHDISSRRQIGTLNEKFVFNFAAPGATFIQCGEMWRVNGVDNEEARVNVSPIEDPGGEVPSWVGSGIPVPTPVAGEVGELHDMVVLQFESGADREAVARDIAMCYSTGEAMVRSALGPIEKQVEADAPIPTVNRLVLEGSPWKVTLNSSYGHRANETLGRFSSTLIGQRTGSSVGMEVDPYRIELDVSRKVRPTTFAEVFRETDPDHIETLLELASKRSDSLKFTLAQAAAKFGVPKRCRGKGRFDGDRPFAALENTPVYSEAVREVFHTDLVVAETVELLRHVRDDDVEFAVAREPTATGTGGRGLGTGLLVPENAGASVIETVRDRTQNDHVLLACLHCKDWA